MTNITLKMLNDANACSEQVVLFKRYFGDSVTVTKELAVKHAHEFDWDFAAGRFLTEDGYKAYEEAIAPHRKACREAEAPHEKAYEEAIAPHEKACREAIALAFVELFLGEN